MKTKWTSTDIFKLFAFNKRGLSRQTLFNAEEKSQIPKAGRIKRGSIAVRNWNYEQIPEIGKLFGFLKPPTKQAIICCYTAKGGVLKTTISYNLAKTLALNGIKTLMIGLDIQCSLTDIAVPSQEYESLEEAREDRLGLFHLLYDKADIKDIINKTEISTLSIIPETHELNILEKKLRAEPRREYIFKDKVLPLLKDFDVIIFDNSPSWNQLIENALVAADVVISPIGCDLLSYKAMETNLNTLIEYSVAMQKKWDHLMLVPTLLERNKLSQQIYGSYLNKYNDFLISYPIRRAIQGQESTLLKRAAIEYDPDSPLAQDYYELIQEIWNKITVTGS